MRTALLALTVALSPFAALAQSEQTLVERYTSLAGSRAGAQALVAGLREGSDIEFTYAGTQLAIDPPTGKMGNGNVNIALALTEASLKDTPRPTAQQFQTALSDVLARRAAGTGWGEIAHSLGFKLGEVMRSDHARPAQRAAHAESRPERAARPDRPGKPERPERAGGR